VKITINPHGIQFTNFCDVNELPCTLHESWYMENGKTLMDHKTVMVGSVSSRMKLDRETAYTLGSLLMHWAVKGNFGEVDEDQRRDGVEEKK